MVGSQTVQILEGGRKKDGKRESCCCVLKVSDFQHHRHKEVKVF